MQSNIDQRQEQFAPGEYGGYNGYVGSPQEPTHAQNYQQNEPQHIFYQSAVGFEQTTYGQQAPFPPAPSLSGTGIAAILSYSLGWFSGLLVFLFAGQNRFVRFHALQSMLFFGSINIIDFAIIRFESIRWLHIPYISGFVLLFFVLINIVACIGWLMAMIQAARGKYYRLPFAGDFAAKCLNLGVIVK